MKTPIKYDPVSIKKCETCKVEYFLDWVEIPFLEIAYPKFCPFCGVKNEN